MLSSPLLLLSQGKRTITLTLTFQPDPLFDNPKIDSLLSNTFKIQISTAKGWLKLKPTPVKTESVDYSPPGVTVPKEDLPLKALRITLTVGKNADPLRRCPLRKQPSSAPGRYSDYCCSHAGKRMSRVLVGDV